MLQFTEGENEGVIEGAWQVESLKLIDALLQCHMSVDERAHGVVVGGDFNGFRAFYKRTPVYTQRKLRFSLKSTGGLGFIT